MTIRVWLLVAAVSVSPLLKAADALELPTEKAKISYLIGRQMGDQLSGPELTGEIDVDILCAAVRQAMAGDESQISNDDARTLMTEFGKRMRERVSQQRDEAGSVNREAGATYLSENIKKEGWQKTESGLQYHVVREGDGDIPVATDMVEVHYRGTLISGEEFDSSYKRNEPATFPVGNVIKGWQEALQLMSVGSKWELAIPSDLAYGPQGKGRQIGPDSVLCFEVELLAIKAPAEGGPAQLR